MSTDKTKQKQRASSQYFGSMGILVAAAIVVLLGTFLVATFLVPRGERINSDGYQVIYTVTGQAYFGKLQNTSGEYLVLREPYTAQDVTPEGEEAPEDKQASTTLLKVSQQQYGPEDVISLKSDQVLFWQNLRDDSKVSQALKN